MKIITLWQPWASLIPLGLKGYETRSWYTTYRGPLLIHAAKRPFVVEDGLKIKVIDQDADRAWKQALELGYEAGILTDKSRIPFAHQLPLGCVVANANLTECLEMAERLNHKQKQVRAVDQTPLELAVGDWQPGRFAWKLEDSKALEPIPWKGGQGLRNAPPELIEKIMRSLQSR